MEYILVLILIVIGLITLGFFFRKKHYREIDKLEAWKMDIMNRPVLDELAKIKQLNMTGETEELFERWRKEWDSIITVYLPDVEELLFDAEEYVDKYRFSKSKEVQQSIEEKLKEIESSIQTILSELHELVGSEEKNRTEIDELKEAYRTSKKALLAHRHTFGAAAGRLEVLLEQVVEVFSEFEEATVNGNYLKAREHVLKIKSMLKELSGKMEVIPDLLVEIQSSLPSQIEELKDGHADMVNQGYILNHIEFEKEISSMEQALDIYAEHISIAETSEILAGMQELRDSMNVLYDLLEKEAVSKQFVHKNNAQLEEGISFIQFENDKLKTEIIFVQQTYHITESELESHRQNEKQLSQLVKRFDVFRVKVEQNQTAFSLLADDMNEIEEGVTSIKKELEAFTVKLQTLRKDEIEARNTVQELKKKLASANKMIVKSNVPGLPISYKEYLQDVVVSLEDVHQKLEEKPLDMAAVHIFLEKAVDSVNEFYDLTSQLIEQMYMAERVIQYGNRYRSKYQTVAVALKNAEDKFMSFEYEQAVEEAASALEKVEPGCLQKLEFELDLEEVK
ncbi:septation ring formation regulator EzrA [Peribacillus alkalitolerans]|uniref:septation ring formation regulator EzrA n=1 Tax=Peribacillus alkalitolerans TaxID=1550385 RepID=UPI0013D14878|nr:septation ring formation regulator EzrA [Peribacillus alkalitolerans]